MEKYFLESEGFTKPVVDPGPEIFLITIEPILGTNIKAEAKLEMMVSNTDIL
jgi:hypothetical protein